jgi:hypothetical protein
MIEFKQYITEAVSTEGKVTHIAHAEDRPIINGAKGFEHAKGALNQAHEHIKSGKKDTGLTMKYDGSPALVFGHHPKTNKFFVATKSAFNKNPKINHTPEDIERNHGDKPELAKKLNQALEHLPKVTPKKGVYQGDMMFGHDDVVHNPNGSASFKPNTITYSAHGQEANKVKSSKVGVVVHQQYHGRDIGDMKASPNIENKFRQHPDVWHKTAEHDTGITNYGQKDQLEFKKHMDAAQKIHDTNKKTMYAATEPHQGAGGHLATYINQTVRNNVKPSVRGLQQHIMDKSQIVQSRLKTAKAAEKKQGAAQQEVSHVNKHSESYENLLKMHQHIAKAKNVLVKTLNQHPGTLSHHIDGKETHPEGYVINHKNEPTKLVDRAEFSRANLMKVRKPNANV